jgi:excisionase family DNA binding protein
VSRPRPSPEGPRPHVEPVYLTAENVAALLQISRASVFRMAKRERTMPALVLGGVVRFPKERLLLWLRQREQGAVPRPRAPKATRNGLDGHIGGHTAGAGETAQAGGSK